MTSILDVNTAGSDDAIRLAGRLAATLSASQRIVVFSGTEPGQDSSTVAADVAAAFARVTHEQVLLIDARADGPELHERFGSSASPGLTEVLGGGTDLESALVRRGSDGLTLLPLGGAKTDVVALFGSESFARLLDVLRTQFRLVVIDVDAILTSAAGAVLASRADGIMAVVVAGHSTRTALAELTRVVEGLKVPMLGAVLASDSPPGPRRRRGGPAS